MTMGLWGMLELGVIYMSTVNSVITIPAYEPNATLIELVTELYRQGEQSIIVVDDGSTEQAALFQRLDSLNNVTVLHHSKNLGKGAALKTAMAYFIKHNKENFHSLITADADGQHCPSDINALQVKAAENPNVLHIGSREFHSTIPWRSRFGNLLTRFLFKVLIGRKLNDTQSGLRAIPKTFIPELLKLKSTGYDFELDMLVLALKQNVGIAEMPIRTIYEPGNPSSHFKLIGDSVRIYLVFIRFCALALTTGLLDLCLFSLTFYFSNNILASMTVARCIAGSYNFYCGKRLVFQSKTRILIAAARYIGLACALMFTAYTAISFFVLYLHWNVYFSKIFSECCLFILSFSIQRTYVFKDVAKKAS